MKAQRDAERFAMAILSSQDPVTDQTVSDAIDGAAASLAAMPSIYGGVEVDRALLRAWIERQINVWAADGSALSDDRDHVPWLDSERAQIDWNLGAVSSIHLRPAPAPRGGDADGSHHRGRPLPPRVARRMGAWDRRGWW